MSNDIAPNAYDALPSPARSFPMTHIARLGAIGRIFGLKTPMPETSRVLDIGCGVGTNLLGMAQLHPGAQFVGIDSSKKQIEVAEEALAFMGLKNVRLICADLTQFEEKGEMGTFDYILAHRVYSWVPQVVREKILTLCREHLSPEGVAYLSYNSLPGWGMRGALRAMMQMHTSGINDIHGKITQARALVKFLAESCTENTAYGNYLRQELELLQTVDDSHIAHDLLEMNHEPIYFRDLLQTAAQNQLLYLGDADPSIMAVDNLPPEAAKTLRDLKMNLHDTEQYMDFVRNQMFRSTLLCHAGVALDRNVTPQRLEGLEVKSLIALKEGRNKSNQAVFSGIGGVELSTNDAFGSEVFTEVANLGLSSQPADELLEKAVKALSLELGDTPKEVAKSELGRIVLNGYFRKMLDLILGSGIEIKAADANLPEALPLARWQASKNHLITTRTLDMMAPDQLVAKLITLCDGTRDREALVRALVEARSKDEFILNENNKSVDNLKRVREIIDALLDGVLKNLRNAGVVLPAVENTIS